MVRAIAYIPRSTRVFRFGEAHKFSLEFSGPFTMHWGENWAIMGPSKTTLMEALVGQLRLAPSPPDGVFPFLSGFDPPKDPFTSVRMVTFAYRRHYMAHGGLYDYSARYGAVREEDRITLRQSLLGDTGNEENRRLLDSLAQDLQLSDKLDLPLIAMSNGQTRRASVLRQLLLRPDVLFLDEPLTGLDVTQKPKLLLLLHNLHQQRNPIIILGLRYHDPMPEWVTNVAIAKEGLVISGPKEDLYDEILRASHHSMDSSSSNVLTSGAVPFSREDTSILVNAKGLNVSYGNRGVLKNINWIVREGDRWQLSGPNGSGKTTLISMLTGDHPQSYIQSHLTLFGSPRRRLATSQIQGQMGIVTPEIFHAFPRRSGANAALTAREAIATGFESTFSYRPRTSAQDGEIDRLLAYFAPVLYPSGGSMFDPDQPFGSLPAGQQALILLLRALAGSPKLIVLDEVFSGMDDHMVALSKRYLREELTSQQAVIFVSHWEDEVPWRGAQLQRFHLGD